CRTALHRRGMCADTGGCPVSGSDCINRGLAIFDDAADELMRQMGMGAVMTAALLKGKMLVGRIINKALGISAYCLRQEIGAVRWCRAFRRHLAALVGLHRRHAK